MTYHPLVTGALVADAAAMGLHWVYDQDHIRALAPDTPEFRTPSAADYEGVKGYFAHQGRAAGEFSQYGEQALVMLWALDGGTYDPAAYARAFHAHFGYGGAYVGYIDGATRTTLNNAIGVEDLTQAKGSDDDQQPAIAKLPALVAAMLDADDAAFFAAVENAVALTNENETSLDWGRVSGAMMRAAARGASASDIVAAGRAHASPEAAALIDEATAMVDQSANAVTEHFGLACFLRSGVPVVIHNILTAPTYTEAVRRNIYAGGDNCGRGILLGAIMGAMHGVGGATGIPQDWIAKTNL